MLNRDVLCSSIALLPLDLREKARIYDSEAEFFKAILDEDIARLPFGARVLEIGSGMGLLSMYIADHGMKVESYEPNSAGFASMGQLRRVALGAWTPTSGIVNWRNEYLKPSIARIDEAADYVFAFNVLEHVPDWRSLVESALTHLRPGATMRFIFPNYLYPYEPHFHMPTLVSKRLTGRLLRTRIVSSSIQDAVDFWNELSWLTGNQMRRFARDSEITAEFSHRTTLRYLDRFAKDPTFKARKGAMFSRAANAAKLPALLKAIPAHLMPIVDCTVSRE